MGKIMMNDTPYGGSLGVTEITKAEYLAKKSEYDSSENFVLIKDAGALTADQVDFDDTETSLGATNVQDAIETVNENLTKLSTYSENEVDTGKIWNGKHVYRKSFSNTLSSYTYIVGNRYAWYTSLLSGVDKVLNVEGWNSQAGDFTNVFGVSGMSSNGGMEFGSFVYITDGTMYHVYQATSNVSPVSFNIVVEYTKS